MARLHGRSQTLFIYHSCLSWAVLHRPRPCVERWAVLTPAPRNVKLISQILSSGAALPWTNWTGWNTSHESSEAGRGCGVPNRRGCELRQFLRQVNHSMRLYRLNLLLSTIPPLSHLFCRTAGPPATEGFPLEFGMLVPQGLGHLAHHFVWRPSQVLTCQSLLHAIWNEKENYSFEPPGVAWLD